MSFVKLLQGIGDRLGILETVPAAGTGETVRIRTRAVSLRDLKAEIRPGAVASLADEPAELAVPFEEIFSAAGLSANPQDWTTDRLKRVIESGDFRGMPRAAVQKAVLVLLESEGVAAEAIVKDAMARDQAMDAYEAAAGAATVPRPSAAAQMSASVRSKGVRGAVVVMHDPDLSRTSDGSGQIGDLTLAEIRRYNAAAKFGGAVAAQKVPTFQDVVDLVNAYRSDQVRPGLGVEAVLENAPDRSQGFFRVPKILD